MFRTTTRHQSARSAVASFALAIALTGGLAVGSIAATSDAAQAQRNRDRDRDSGNEEARNSPGFVAAYQPAQVMTTPETANFEGARAALPGVIAAIETPADRNLAGNLSLVIGQNLQDQALQRQGLELMVQSGLTPPERLGLFNFFIGSLSYNAGDYAAARSAMEAALAAGYVNDDEDARNDPEYVIFLTHVAEENEVQAITYLMQQHAARQAAGQTTPERWLLGALQESYNLDDGARVLTAANALLATYPTDLNWQNSLRMVNQLYELEPQARIDLARLMRHNNALVDRAEYVRYIEDLDPRLMSNEVQTVLALGLANGVFTQTDPYYVEVKGIADSRAPGDRNGADRMIAEARTGDGLDAVGAGDVLYSLGDFVRAEEMYRLALSKGYDANTANTRIGIAQAEQGNYAGAIASFEQVSGARAPVAGMWATYARQQLAGS